MCSNMDWKDLVVRLMLRENEVMMDGRRAGRGGARVQR